jgi:hypothetical protein
LFYSIQAETLPAAKAVAPKKGNLLVKKAKVVEEVQEEDNDDGSPSAAPAPASKPAKASLVKKAAPAATAAKKAPLLPKSKAPPAKKAPTAAPAAAAPEGPVVKRSKNAYFIFTEENRAKLKGTCLFRTF